MTMEMSKLQLLTAWIRASILKALRQGRAEFRYEQNRVKEEKKKNGPEFEHLRDFGIVRKVLVRLARTPQDNTLRARNCH